MANPILYGPGYSTYVRSVRLALEEKGVDYDHVEFDFMQGMPDDQLERQPFSKVPAFEHDSSGHGPAPTCRTPARSTWSWRVPTETP